MPAFKNEAELLKNATSQFCRDLGAQIEAGLPNVRMTAGQSHVGVRVAFGHYIPPSQATQGQWEVHVAANWLDPVDPSLGTPFTIEKKKETLRHEFIHRMGVHHHHSPDTFYYANVYCAPGGPGRGLDS